MSIPVSGFYRKKMASLYLEEKKRAEDLQRLLREEKTKVHSLGMGLEEETKRSLGMEAELERYLLQITSQVSSGFYLCIFHKPQQGCAKTIDD